MWETVSLLWNWSQADCNTVYIWYVNRTWCNLSVWWLFRCRLRLVVFFPPSLWLHLPPSPSTTHTVLLSPGLHSKYFHRSSHRLRQPSPFWPPRPFPLPPRSTIDCVCDCHGCTWPHRRCVEHRCWAGVMPGGGCYQTRQDAAFLAFDRHVKDGQKCHAVWASDPLTFSSSLVNEHSNTSPYVLVIKEPC